MVGPVPSEAAEYLIPSPEDLSDHPATTLHLVHDSMAVLSGRVTRLKSKHAHAESPHSRTRRQIANVRVWRGPADLFSRSVFDVLRVRGGVADRYVGVYETGSCRVTTGTRRGSSAGAGC